MKLLVIASDIGKTAAGIVYETIIRELAKDNDISLISSEIKSNINQSSVKILRSVSTGYRHYKLDRYSMVWLGVNIFDYKWVLNQRRLIKKADIDEIDIIISLASFSNYKEIMLGHYLAKKYNKKSVIYSVDAIPAPIEWMSNERLHKKTCEFISKYILSCDAFFSANTQMLEYQMKIVKNFKNYSGVILTPMREKCICNVIETNTNPVFLYTGYLYGPRKIDSLMQGFRQYLEYKPKAKIVFIGQNDVAYFELYKDLLDSGNIEIVGFTNELSKYYDKATTLLDINSVYDNDVYLSSKIANYLSLNKPIIAISGHNSPVRNIFTEDDSIVHCFHEADEIYNAMIKVDKQGKVNLDKRNTYAEMFSVEKVLVEFKGIMQQLINK